MTGLHITQAELEMLRALCEKATPEPWEDDPATNGVYAADGAWIAEFHRDEDRELMTAVRNVLPRLLARVNAPKDEH